MEATVDPHAYLKSKLAEVELALEDFEAMAEDTPSDQQKLASLEAVRTKLLQTLVMLEAEKALASRAAPRDA